MKKLNFLFISLPLCLILACGQTIPTQNTSSVMITRCDTTVHISKNGTATVKLPLISSTGYAWQLANQSDATLLEKVSDQAVITPLEKNDADGNTEIQTFSLKATNKTGTNVLTFEYKRSFEKDKPPLKICIITIEIK